MLKRGAVVAAATLFWSVALVAEQGILVVNVVNTANVPMAHVRIGTVGDGSTLETDSGGHARIRLAPQTQANSVVTLQVLAPPPDLTIISPWDQRVRVPPFDNESDNYVQVVLVRRGDRRELEDGAVILSAIARSVRSTRPKRRPATRGGPRGATPGDRGILHVAFQPPPPPAASDQPPLVTDDVAKGLGFSRAEVDAAIRRFGIDPLMWKLTVLTGLVETGGHDPFSSAWVEPAQNDLTFGIGQWSIGRGTLQPVLKQMRASDTPRFDRIMEADAAWMQQWLDLPAPAALASARERLLRSRDIREPWKSRFGALGRSLKFQSIQLSAMRSFYLGARARMRSLELRSERAAAFVYDLSIAAGFPDRRQAAFEQDKAAFRVAIGRNPDEQESMLLIANRAVPTALPPQITARVRERFVTFAVGEGTVFGTPIDLLDAGIGMRDVETGAPIALVNDAAMLQRLRSGWTPGGAQR